MKTRIFSIIIACALITTTATAQENVKRAFEKFVASKYVEVQKTFSEERDFTKPGNPLVGKADVYTFTLKAKHRKLIDEVLAAFDKDRDNEHVYSVLTHTGGHDVPLNARQLLVGDDEKNAVYIGQNKMESWQLICLLDPDNTSNTHRYAYAIEWNNDRKAWQGSGKISGKLVITYSRIPQTIINSYRKRNDSTTSHQPTADTEDIATKISTEILQNDRIKSSLKSKAQVLAVFEALRTQFLKGNTVNTRMGTTITQSIYTICDSFAPMLKEDPALCQKLIANLTEMINRCDKNSDLGRSHIDYLQLAIKALQ